MGENFKKDNKVYKYYSITHQDEISSGERLFVEIDGQAIVIVNIDGEIYAIADRCSHDDGPLGDGEIVNHIIKCPRHGATFDIKTGKVLSLPAIVDIPVYPVKIVKGEILVGIPDEV